MMGPSKGSREYEQQACQVQAFLRNVAPTSTAEEDQVLLLFVLDKDYSREAIMDGLGRWRTEARHNI